MKKVFKILMCLCLTFSLTFISACKKKNTDDVPSSPAVTFDNSQACYGSVGVWWWNDELDADTYLNFAKSNSVNEVYYCSSKFNQSTADFISKANQKDIKVFWLAGEHAWLNSSEALIQKIQGYNNYQSDYPTAKFAGIHLDIEPHQSDNFDANRKELITSLVELAAYLKEKYPSITFDYDLPFWLHDEVTIYEGGTPITKPAYKHMIDIANRIFLMSYRDTAEAIKNVSKEEIEYALSVEKTIVLGVETKSSEGDNVSFMEESKTEMYAEIIKLAQTVPGETGITFHQIKTWYDLKD